MNTAVQVGCEERVLAGDKQGHWQASTDWVVERCAKKVSEEDGTYSGGRVVVLK